MARSDTPIAAVIDEVHQTGLGRSGRRAYASWSGPEPLLQQWATAGEAAAAARALHPGEQDRVIAALIRHGGTEPLGQLTVVSVLGRALGSVVAGWARAGIPPAEVTEMEADLVAGCWEAVAELAGQVTAGGPIPARVGLRLVDRARESVRGPRRRVRRAQAHQQPLDATTARVAVPGRSGCEALSVEISRAVRAGRLRHAEAAPLFLTRVVGFDVAEAARRLGCSAGVLRAVRSRAERRLIAAAA